MKNIFYISIIAIILSSCGSEDVNNNNIHDGYDRVSMLDNLVTNIIIPSHEDLLTHLNELDASVTEFGNNANNVTLQDLRKKWISAYKIFQHVEMFSLTEIGEEIYYGTKMNTFPVKDNYIDDQIENVDPNLWNLANNSGLFKAQGFPALDYLLYGLENDSNDIINNYTDGSNHFLYLQDVVKVMISNTEIVIDWWKNNKTSYVNSSDNTSTSSANMLLNDFAYYYEKDFRTYKFGLPIGVWVEGNSSPMNTNAEILEGYFHGVSQKTLAIEAINAIEKFFNGTSYDNNQLQGESFKSYLQYLGEDDLVSEIESNFTNIKNKINQLDKSFLSELGNCGGFSYYDFEAGLASCNMIEAWSHIQENVANFKVKMFGAFGVELTFSSGDND